VVKLEFGVVHEDVRSTNCRGDAEVRLVCRRVHHRSIVADEIIVVDGAAEARQMPFCHGSEARTA